MSTNTLTPNSVNFTWVQPANPDTSVPTAWQVISLPCGSPTPTAATTGWIDTTSNPYSFTGLTPATCYDLYVRAICPPTDSSTIAEPTTITTPATCSAPTTLTSSAVLSTSVNFGWTQPANPDSSVATAWQVISLPCGSPAPTATTLGWIDTTSNPYSFTGLSSTTCYNFYVRAICSTSDSSPIVGPIIVTTQAAPPICGGNFVDAAGPSANYANNSNVTTTICPINLGDVVTVTFTAFNTEANWDGLYVYNGNAVVLANLIASANPAGNVPGGLAGSYWGTAIPGPFTSTSADGCLTFVFRSDATANNPGWISNVTCDPAPTCSKPTLLGSSALTSNSVSLNWTQPANPDTSVATTWQVLALPCGSTAPTAGSTGWIQTTSNPYALTGLTSATCYDIYVRAVCSPSDSSGWTGPRTVTTQVAPPICGGNFVDEGGPTANYANSSNVTTTICPTNTGEIVTVTFTSFNTEATWDGLYVYDGSSVTPSALLATTNPPGNVPGGLAGSYWGNLTGANLPGPFTSTSADGCLTFVFRSDGSINNPGWISNVTCSPAPTCSKPTSLTAINVTQTSATLTWTQPPNPDSSVATAWEVLVLPAGSPVPTGAGIPATSPYLVTGLTAGTAYVFYVRAICSSTDASMWAGLNFATKPINDECTEATFAIVNQNLNCVQTTPGTLAGATGSTQTTTCAGAANDDVWFTFTATAATHVISFNNVTPATTLDYAIYQGTNCGSLTQVGCNSGANLVAGTTYFIRVYSDTAVPQFTNFNLCIGTLPCTEAPAFCTGQTVTYANATNVPSLGTIGCLFTSPNPAFFFLQVNQAGPLSYLISQVDTGGTPRDVDYVAWGPFTDLNTACTGVPANPLPGLLPALTPAQGCSGTLHACSYSINATEIMCIPNAQLCEVYVIMITNFSNQAGTVTFTQTNSGGGTTECFPINTFNYPQTYYCQNGTNPTPVLAPGAAAGTYTSTAGLVIDSATGTIDLAASTPGPYVITSTTLTSTGGACTNIPSITTTRTVVITAAANATIAYASPSYCNSITASQSAIRTGTSGGTYSASPAGLLLGATTGEIIPIASSPGVYTITYTVAATGGCPAFTTTTQVEIIAAPIPAFTQVAPICPGDPLAALPTSSNDATPITGTWSPAIDNTATTTYTFTPDAGQCARTTTMTINVGSTTPTFDSVAAICPGATLAPLPTTSTNGGITGTWSPPLDNTQTTTYTFTPTSGACISTATLTIQVLSPTIVPTFNDVPPICPNGVINALPTTSLNGITGTWSPALDNTQTTTYTFTPDTGQCGLTTTLTIIVNPPLVVSVNSPTFCPGASTTMVATPAIAGTYTYTWTVPSGVTNPGNVASFTTTVAGTYSVVIDQTSSFCNTDFESPLATGTTPNLVSEDLVPCWDTTAGDGIIELWPPGFEGVTAYSGNQLIELNANTVGTLFQDFTVIPGTTMSVSFAHRGRQGNDVVGVEIGPVGGPYVSLGNFTDGNTAWGLHSVNYTIPTGSGNNYTLRFVSVSSTGGNPSVGNLLDSISISALSCTSAPATGIATSVGITPVTTFTYTTPVCQNAITNPLPDTSTTGFTTGGMFTSNPATGIDINPTTGEINLALTTAGTYDITYATLADTSICQDAGSSTFTIVINPIVNPVLGFNYTSPICQNASATLSPTLVTGFTSGGTFTSTTGLSINSTTGVINLANSTAGTYTITYTSNANTASCLVSGTDTATIVINLVITPVTTFNYDTPFCASSGSESPNLGTGFTTGGTFSSTAGLIIDASTGVIDLSSTPGTYTVTYSVAANTSICQVAATGTTEIMIIPPVTIALTGGCQSVSYILTASGSFNAETASYVWHDTNGVIVGNTQSIIIQAVGTYTVTVTVDGCDTVSAPFNVASISCIIQQGISVNNDGMNDTFDLTGFDVKKLTIFNRLGTKVYSRGGYINEWGGKSDDGDELPDGTYFYVIDRNTGDTKTGWIYINRAQ